MARLNPDHEPCFLMGDFNAVPNDAPIQWILGELDDASATCNGIVMGPEATYNDFLYDTLPPRRIDYIFHQGEDLEITALAPPEQYDPSPPSFRRFPRLHPGETEIEHRSADAATTTPCTLSTGHFRI